MQVHSCKNLIDGNWEAGTGSLTVTSPYDGAQAGRVALAGPQHVEQALKAAWRDRRALLRAGTRLRAELLFRVRERMQRDEDALAQLICAEAGKPVTFAKGEVRRAQETILLSAEEARRMPGEYMPLDTVPGAEGCHGFVRRMPRGPATALWPFNFPLNLLTHKAGPALASGCPVLLRPPSATPLSGQRFARYVHEEAQALGLPGGTVAYLACSHATAAPLIEDPRVAAVSFTGSGTVGWELKQRANRKQVMLELGGQAAMIVEPDAPDLAFAAKRAALAAFAYAGQVCISLQRLYVHKKIWDKFMAAFMAEVAAVKTGDPRDPAVIVGPVIDDAADERISAWVAEAVARKAKLLCGERLGPRLFSPHVFERLPAGTQLYCEEAFGPLVAVEPYAKFEDAVELANASRFGLQAAVFTSNIAKVLGAWRDVEVGGLIVNDYPMFRVDQMPYGGVKESGFGREGVRYAIQEYTEPRLMVVRE